MPTLTMFELHGDPDEIVAIQEEKILPTALPAAAENGGISQTVVKTDDGVLVVNLWESEEGMRRAAARVRPVAEATGLVQVGWRQYEVLRHRTPAGEPAFVPSDGGEARWWFGGLGVIRATAADTGGRMTIVEVMEPAGAEAPLHVHHAEDEAFFVLDGSVVVQIGDRRFELAAGDYAYTPRDIPHRYTVGADGCRMLLICTPGGFERFVRETSEPARTRTLPPPSGDEPDWEHVAAVAQANGCELLA